MFTKPIFETLPIALIASGILLVAFVHHPVSLAAGIGLVLSSCYMIYRRVNDMARNTKSENELTPIT